MADEGLSFDIDLKVDDLQRKADEFPKAVEAGLKLVGKHAQAVAVRFAGQISDRPIPTNKQVYAYRKKKRAGKRVARPKNPGGSDGSQPAWERTGSLLKAVKAEPTFTKDSVTLEADVDHAKSRHQLFGDAYGDTPAWEPKEPALGIKRRNPFFAQTVKQIEPKVGPLFEDGFNKSWGK